MGFIKFLIVLIVAVSAAVLIQTTPGMLLIEVGEYSFAGPLWLMVLLGLAGLLAIKVTFRFVAWVINAPRGIWSFIFGSKTAKIDRNLKEFLIASIVGNAAQERKNLKALSKLKFYPGLCAAKAALLALRQSKALDYLESVEVMKSDLEIHSWMVSLVELQEAMVAPETAEKTEKIEALLKALKNEREVQSVVWSLEAEQAIRLQDFPRLREATTKLKSLRLLSADLYLKILSDCDLGQLSQASTLESLRHIWDDLPRTRKKNPLFIARFANKQDELGDREGAVQALETGLHHAWSEELFALYGAIISKNCVKQLEKAEKWTRDLAPTASNYLALGRLYEANMVLVKAEQCYEKSLQIEKTPHAYAGLAEVMMAKGQWQQAAQYYKKSSLQSS